MILDILNKENEIILTQYQKSSGIYWVSKYLPLLCKHKKTILIDSIEEWYKIKKEFPEKVALRTDTKLGQEYPNIRGRTCSHEHVEKYYNEAKQKVKKPYLLCMDLADGAGDRIKSKGGFHINVTIGGNVYIRHAGIGFDYGDLIKRKAEHERWVIPWHDIPNIDTKNIGKYHIQTISQRSI